VRKTQGGKETDIRTRGRRYEIRRKEGGKNEEPRQDLESQRLIGDKLLDRKEDF
jgi:hypothetical protein